MNPESINKIKSAKKEYNDMVSKLDIYTKTLRVNAEKLPKEEQTLINSMCRVIDEMTNDIKSRGIEDAQKRKAHYGDIKLYTDAASVLDALYKGITEPEVESAQKFSGLANHFKKQHLSDIQSHNLFNARINACAVIISLVLACILCFTPLAPLALLDLATAALCTHFALDGYKSSARYDQVTDQKAAAMIDVIRLNATSVIHTDKDLIAIERGKALKNINKQIKKNATTDTTPSAPEQQVLTQEGKNKNPSGRK